jgi:uncharacterized protein (DUF697 family)
MPPLLSGAVPLPHDADTFVCSLSGLDRCVYSLCDLDASRYRIVPISTPLLARTPHQHSKRPGSVAGGRALGMTDGLRLVELSTTDDGGLVTASAHMGLRWAWGFAPVLVLNQTTVSSSFVTQPNWTGQEPCLWKVIPSLAATAWQSAALRMTLSIEHSVPPSPITGSVAGGPSLGMADGLRLVELSTPDDGGLVTASAHMGLRWACGFAPVLVLNQTTFSSSFVTQPYWMGQEPSL